MKTEYKYIHFEKRPNPGKKMLIYACISNRDRNILGYVVWWGAWWKYVFKIENIRGKLIFDDNCFDDINAFLKQLNIRQRILWAEARRKKK